MDVDDDGVVSVSVPVVYSSSSSDVVVVVVDIKSLQLINERFIKWGRQLPKNSSMGTESHPSNLR